MQNSEGLSDAIVCALCRQPVVNILGHWNSDIAHQRTLQDMGKYSLVETPAVDAYVLQGRRLDDRPSVPITRNETPNNDDWPAGHYIPKRDR